MVVRCWIPESCWNRYAVIFRDSVPWGEFELTGIIEAVGPFGILLAGFDDTGGFGRREFS